MLSSQMDCQAMFILTCDEEILYDLKCVTWKTNEIPHLLCSFSSFVCSFVRYWLKKHRNQLVSVVGQMLFLQYKDNLKSRQKQDSHRRKINSTRGSVFSSTYVLVGGLVERDQVGVEASQSHH